MQGAPNLVCPDPWPVELDAVVIDRKEVEVVSAAKLLGLTISADLTWNAHIEEVVKKASQRFYFLVQPKPIDEKFYNWGSKTEKRSIPDSIFFKELEWGQSNE